MAIRREQDKKVATAAVALVRLAVSAVEEVVHGHRQRQHQIEGEKRNISGSGSGNSRITAKLAMMRKQKWQPWCSSGSSSICSSIVATWELQSQWEIMAAAVAVVGSGGSNRLQLRQSVLQQQRIYQKTHHNQHEIHITFSWCWCLAKCLRYVKISTPWHETNHVY